MADYRWSYVHCVSQVAYNRSKSRQWQNNIFLRVYPSLTSSFEWIPLTQEHKILSLKTGVLGAAHSEDFVILVCTVLIHITSVMDRQTDGQMPRRWLRCILLSCVKIQTLTYLVLMFWQLLSTALFGPW